MIRNIERRIDFLKIPASPYTKEDAFLIQDMKDTLTFHKAGCVGMAANMIGFSKAVIIISDHGKQVVMMNPKIIKKSGKEYTVKEGCLSLSGERETKRFEKIQVEYQNEAGKIIQRTYSDFTAEIIQHEMDHLEGKII